MFYGITTTIPNYHPEQVFTHNVYLNNEFRTHTFNHLFKSETPGWLRYTAHV